MKKLTNKKPHPFDTLCEGFIKDGIFEFLCRKYVQRADYRQKKLGLQYTSAETHDLAEELAKWISTNVIGV